MATAARELEPESACLLHDVHLLYLVDLEKTIDEKSVWWRRALYFLVYRPFMRLFNWLGIPRPEQKRVNPDGSVDWYWFEKMVIVGSEEEADRACLNQFYVITPMEFGVLMPEESIHHHGQIRPRASKPYRYAEPIRSFFVAKRCSTVHSEEQSVASAIEKIQRITAKLKEPLPL